MSFFRVLLALLIAGGIAYGLYHVAEKQSAERPVEAVRTEIAEPSGAAGSEETDAAALAEVEALTENAADTDEGESAETPGEVAETETAAVAPEGVAEPLGENPSDTDEGEAAEAPGETAETEIAAAAPETVAAPLTETPSDTDEGEGAETPGEQEETAAVASEPDALPVEGSSGWEAKVESSGTFAARTGESLADADAIPDPTDEGESAETAIAALPAVRLAGATSNSVDALKIVTGGMTYREALATLIDAGWKPRPNTERSTGETEPNAAEAVLIEAGYSELEGCKEGDRPICRFEFVDGEKRIAAVITAGTGTDPGVIDAFLMKIRAD